MFSKIFRRLSLQTEIATAEESRGLKRTLTASQLVLIGIGAIIGAGIFVMTGKAAALYAGPAVVLSFLFAAAICALAGLCYAELAALIPMAGGSYSYAYVALGELPAWLIGWCVSAQYIFSSSTVAAGWSGYFISFLRDYGIVLPDFLTCAPLGYSPELGWYSTGMWINLPAMLLILALGCLVCIGVSAAAKFNNAMVAIKLATVGLFVLVGLPHIQSENLTPLIPANTGLFGQFGFSGIIRAAAVVFFAYPGFEAVATLAQESRNPQRDLPRGILGSLLICSLAYMLVCLVLTGVTSYTTLNVPDPMAVALNAIGPQYFWISSVIKVAILAGLSSVCLVLLMAQTRVFYSIGKDGLLPKPFSTLHKTLRTPVTATLIAMVSMMLLTGFLPVDILGQLVCMAALLIFGVVCLAVPVLRRTHKSYARPFKVPFAPWLPLLGVAACASLMAALPAVTWVQLILWIGLGLGIYAFYGFKNSKLARKR